MAAQKPPQQHLAGETSLLRTTRSPTAVVRAPVTSRGQPPFEVNRLTQISRAPSCRRERFCQGGNRFRKVVLAVLRLRLATFDGKRWVHDRVGKGCNLH